VRGGGGGGGGGGVGAPPAFPAARPGTRTPNRRSDARLWIAPPSSAPPPRRQSRSRYPLSRPPPHRRPEFDPPAGPARPPASGRRHALHLPPTRERAGRSGAPARRRRRHGGSVDGPPGVAAASAAPAGRLCADRRGVSGRGDAGNVRRQGPAGRDARGVPCPTLTRRRGWRRAGAPHADDPEISGRKFGFCQV